MRPHAAASPAAAVAASSSARHKAALAVLGKQSSRPVIGSRYKPAAPDYSDAAPVALEYASDGERRVLRAATLTQLVQTLTSNERSPDMASLQHILVAHAHFVPSAALFSRLVAEFESSAGDAQNNMHRKLRVLNIVKSWLAMPAARALLLDDAPELLGAFERFLETLKATNVGLAHYLETAARLRSDEGTPYEPAPVLPNAPSPPALTDLDALAVAKELCLRDQALLQALELPELYRTRWVTSGAAPHIDLAAECSNLTSFFFATRILGAGSVKAQARAWAHVVQIGAHLLELQNYQSLLSVFLALKLPPVQRALATFRAKDVPRRAHKQWASIDAAMSPQSNFAGYRALIKDVRPPLLPCYEVHLKDLLYQTEGQPDFISEGVLNVLKLDSMGRIINMFVQAQHTPYDFAPDVAVRRALSLSATTIEQLQSELDQLASRQPGAPKQGEERSTSERGSERGSEGDEEHTSEEDALSISSSASHSHSLTHSHSHSHSLTRPTRSLSRPSAAPSGVALVPPRRSGSSNVASTSTSTPAPTTEREREREREREVVLERREKQLQKRERALEKRERALARQAEEDASEADSLRVALERKQREIMGQEAIIRELRAKVAHLEEALLANTILQNIHAASTAPSTLSGTVALSETRHVLVRRMDQREGGVRVPVPQTCAELVLLAGHQLNVKAAGVRNINYHKITDPAKLQDDAIVYVTTEADEFKLSILGL